MKIRDKLFFAFGLYIFLAAVLGFLAYNELRTITAKLTLVEIADDITNTLLEVRRYEKNYLLFRDDNSYLEVNRYLEILKKYIDKIGTEITEEIGSDKYKMMKKAIAEYEGLLASLSENLKLQDEMAKMVMAEGRSVEQRLSGSRLRDFLVVRRHEKNLIIYKDGPTYSNFERNLRAARLDSETERYDVLTKRLYRYYEEEKDSIEKMRITAREIQSFTENLSKSERADIGGTLSMSMKLLLFALIAVLLTGIVINWHLAVSISTPIRKLEKITKKVAQGDFSETIEISGGDEIASLQISFNQMEEMLRDAMDSLEQTVTKLQEKQAQLVEAEKLASIGKLAAGIAHEINNPLTSVLTFSSLLLEQCPEDDPRYERLRMIVRETRRVRNIVRQVLSFAKEAPLRTEKISLNHPVREIVESLDAQEAFKGIDLELDLADDLPDILIDPVQIGQVVLNILLNATHAITPPGKIRVSTRAADNFAELIISDTGKGIPEDHLQKIFDPFFTTKDKSRGTGLGLAVSYGIIKKHRGDIEVRSIVNEGSTFVVRLPLHG
ncbi:MAG: HAMP domain-containing protein [Nitrospiraceae bacterium]|jgi:signal transduction histidine kinase|nr:MAG: HAMP domain-containing protein [Nitrospiraceae bacterium]